jgi:hypothetical protein
VIIDRHPGFDRARNADRCRSPAGIAAGTSCQALPDGPVSDMTDLDRTGVQPRLWLDCRWSGFRSPEGGEGWLPQPRGPDQFESPRSARRPRRHGRVGSITSMLFCCVAVVGFHFYRLFKPSGLGMTAAGRAERGSESHPARPHDDDGRAPGQSATSGSSAMSSGCSPARSARRGSPRRSWHSAGETTNLRVELADDADVGRRAFRKGEVIDTGLDVPRGRLPRSASASPGNRTVDPSAPSLKIRLGSGVSSKPVGTPLQWQPRAATSLFGSPCRILTGLLARDTRLGN